jgi:hypothetical protein
MFTWSFTTIKTSCVSKAKRAVRWMMGQRFPPGFDEWCRISEPPAQWGDITYQDFRREIQQNQSDQVAVNNFNSRVTRLNAHWKTLRIDPPGYPFEFDVQFHEGRAPRFDRMTLDATDVWNLETGNVLHALRVSGLTVHNVKLPILESSKPIQLTNCVIGRLHLADMSGRAYRISLEMYGCWVGTLVLPQSCLKNLSITGGGVANIDCPPAYGDSPFTGAVTFKKVFFPTSPLQSRLFEGPEAYRGLHAHLMKHDNVLMANLIRALLLRSERETERWFAWFTNWFYGTFAKYGTSPGRPLVWLLVLYILTALYIYRYDQGAITQPIQFYTGAYSALLDWQDGRFHRSLLLPLQSLANPFGVFFDPRKIIIPSTPLGAILLTIQGLISDVLLLMTALSIRRRFKAT